MELYRTSLSNNSRKYAFCFLLEYVKSDNKRCLIIASPPVSANYMATFTIWDALKESLWYLYMTRINTLPVSKTHVWLTNVSGTVLLLSTWLLKGAECRVANLQHLSHVSDVSAKLSRRCTQTLCQETDNLVFQMLSYLIFYLWSVIFED